MRLSHYIKGLRKYVSTISGFAKTNNLNSISLVADGIWCWMRYGCVLNQFLDGRFYERKFFERNRILTYRRWEKLIPTYNDKAYTHILQEKADFNRFFSSFIGREWMLSKTMTLQGFTDFMMRHNFEAIVKPVADNEGHGVRLLKVTSETMERSFAELQNEEFLIEERLAQHPDMEFGAQSVNTIRAYSVYDSKTQKAYVLKTTLRVGVGNAVVDNSHSGGISYEIDIATGRIVSKGWSHAKSNVCIHPGTEIYMPGREIPHWQQVVELVEKAASMIPQVKFIGWDVAIKKDGPVLIEGNHDPDLDLLEFVGSYGYYDTIMQHLRK